MSPTRNPPPSQAARSPAGPASAAWAALAGLLLLTCGPDGAPSAGGGSDASAALEAPRAARSAELDADVAAAIERALEAVRSAPRDALARRELGRVYESNSLFELAERAYAQAAELDPEDARAWYHAARARRELGRLASAREALDRVRALAPDYAPAARRSGEWWLQAGAFAAAEREFESAAELAPHLPDGTLGLARTALARGDAARAEVLARAVLSAHPDTLYAQHVLGSALRDQGRLEEAGTAFARSRGVLPTWNDPWVDEAEALVSGLSLRMIEARALLEHGATARAAEQLRGLLAEHPDDVTLQGMLTAALVGERRFDEALAMLTAARERQPDHFRIELNLALVHYGRGDSPSALAQVERSLELHPDHASAHLLRGRILAQRGEAAGAVEAFLAALRCGADPVVVLPRLGRLQVALERWADAAATYERAAQLLPDDASIHAYLSGSRAELGDRDGAREALERARALDPSHPLLPSIEARLAELDGGSER